MPPRAIAQVTLDRDSGLSEDRIVNVFHFEADATNGNASDFTDRIPGLVDRLEVFYQTIGPRMSGTLAGTGTIKLYDWEAPKPRIPRVEEPFTFLPGEGSLPGEVALCLSYAAAPQSGMSQGRRRGRVYLGPWNGSQGGTADASDVRPPPSLIALILPAAKIMATGTNGAFRLAVFSPTQASVAGQADAAWNDVAELSIDNAWDTQRRRGASPTARTVETL